MAIQHTQGKWTKSNPATTNKRLFAIHVGKLLVAKTCDHLDRFNNSLITPEQAKANAALICDAVNNTAGKGIDPVAVPGLLKALQECVKHITHNDPDIPAVLIEAKKAIKSAEIK